MLVTSLGQRLTQYSKRAQNSDHDLQFLARLRCFQPGQNEQKRSPDPPLHQTNFFDFPEIISLLSNKNRGTISKSVFEKNTKL